MTPFTPPPGAKEGAPFTGAPPVNEGAKRKLFGIWNFFLETVRPAGKRIATRFFCKASDIVTSFMTLPVGAYHS